MRKFHPLLVVGFWAFGLRFEPFGLYTGLWAEGLGLLAGDLGLKARILTSGLDFVLKAGIQALWLGFKLWGCDLGRTW